MELPSRAMLPPARCCNVLDAIVNGAVAELQDIATTVLWPERTLTQLAARRLTRAGADLSSHRDARWSPCTSVDACCWPGHTG